MTKRTPKPRHDRRTARTEARMFEVALRRDVQQIARVRVEARTPQAAIAVAEGIADEVEWRVEEHIGTHKTQAKALTPSR